MKKISIFLALLISSIYALAQKETYIWYFGNHAGIDFNSGAPVGLSNGAFDTNEGSSSICDGLGNLLFYTDGDKCYDKNHNVMPNGSGLLGGWSSSQSALIVKQPLSANLYYVFTCDEFSGADGLSYSIVDMSLNGGNGDITTKNVQLYTPTSEKITAVKNFFTGDVWVITHEMGTNNFVAHSITSAGINPVPVISGAGTIYSTFSNSEIGMLKASHNGKRLAASIHGLSTYEFYDFDNATGIVSNAITCTNSQYSGAYGLEWSGNNRFVYGAIEGTGSIYQWDMQAGSAAAICSTAMQIGTSVSGGLGTLQMGPDKKIYHALNQGLAYLSVINYPDSLGMACDYDDQGFTLPSPATSRLGLPNFVASYFGNLAFVNNLCLGDTTSFAVADSISVIAAAWDFGDPGSGPANNAYTFSANHYYSSPGVYNVQLINVYLNGTSDTIPLTVTINVPTPVSLGNDTTVCIGQSLVLNPGLFNSYLWSNSATTSSISVSNSGAYSITVTDPNGCKAQDSILITFVPCVGVIANIAASDSAFCDKNCIDFTDLSQNNPTSWMWYFAGGSPDTSTLQHPQSICYNNYGSFDVTLVACNSAGCDSVVFQNFITEFQLPAAPIVTLTGNTLSSTPAFAYQWFIVGDTTVYSTAQSFTPAVNGNYYVLISDTNGCQVPGNVVGFYSSLQTSQQPSCHIYYQQQQHALVIPCLSQLSEKEVTYTIYDVHGKCVQSGIKSMGQNNNLLLSHVVDGIYLVSLHSQHQTYTYKFIKN